MEPSKTQTDPPSETILGQNAMGVPPDAVRFTATELEKLAEASRPEPKGATVFCPECEEHVVIRDVHAFVLGVHQRVCSELERVNGVDA